MVIPEAPGNRHYRQMLAEVEAGTAEIVDEVIDTAEGEAVRKRAEAKAFLDSTDWYIVRKAETGEEVPADILKQRGQARIDADEQG